MPRSRPRDDEPERYADLLAELRRGAPRSVARPYRVMLLGRWSELDAPPPAGEQPVRRARGAPTPLAAPALAIDIEDADGERHLELTSVVAGQRYAIGKGDGCDIVVNGVYASRRHCEIWFDKGAWWVADTGSTNGIRVESANGAVARSQQGPQGVPPSAADRSSRRRVARALRAGARRAAAVSAIVAATRGGQRTPRVEERRIAADPGDADRAAAPPRGRVDHHGSHGLRRSQRRCAPRARFRFASAARAIRRW